MDMDILTMKDIGKTFGGVRALRGVTFTVQRGEIHGLCGENGAGKSTLMKILGGYYPAGTYEGEMHLNGRVLKMYTPRDARNAGIAMIYQEISLHPDLSVAENIFMGKLPRKGTKVDWPRMNAEARRALELVGLDVNPTDKAFKLNMSQQQLLMIARAITEDAKILILDEPSSALTLAEVERLQRILMELKSKGITCIYITHKLNELVELADRITVLRDGELVGTLSRDQFHVNKIVTMMVGRTITNLYPKEPVELGGEVLRVENLSVPHPRLKWKKLVDNVSFYLRKGEILGLAGLVGSGRSEIVNAIYGSLRRVSGDIYVEGQKVSIQSPADALRNGIGLVTEDRKATGLVPGLPIRDNISLAALWKVSRRGIINKSKEKAYALEYMRLLAIKAPSIITKVRNLSGGNQQKVAVAKCLMTQPKVLLLDEPTRGIDVGTKYEMYKLMTALAKAGMGIVMISSELPEMLGMCDRFLVISGGRICDEFPREEASEDRVMKSATGTVNR